MINDIPKYMAISLMTTVVVEIIVSLLLGMRDKKDMLNVFLVNVLTNPAVVSLGYAVNVYFGYKVRLCSLVFLEITAVLLEGAVYKKYLNFKKIGPYKLSIVLNVSSYVVGVLVGNFM